MKIYTSQIPQMGKTLLILNKSVTFDRFGIAEVEEDLGNAMIKANSEWYSSKKFDKTEQIKEVEKDIKSTEEKDKQVVGLKTEIERLKQFDQDRLDTIKLKDEEIEELKSTIQTLADSQKPLMEKLEATEKELETLKQYYEAKKGLEVQKIDELRSTASTLGLPEAEFVKLKKEELVELILNTSFTEE